MYFSSLDKGNPASSNYRKDPIAEMYARTNAMRQNYFQGLKDRAESVKTLESMAMTSPEYQLKKYLWQTNEQMMPMYEEQQQQQQMQPWQIYAGQQQQPQPQAGGVLSGTMPMAQITPQVQPMTQNVLSGTDQQTATEQAPTYSYGGGSYYQPMAINQNLLSGGIW